MRAWLRLPARDTLVQYAARRIARPLRRGSGERNTSEFPADACFQLFCPQVLCSRAEGSTRRADGRAALRFVRTRFLSSPFPTRSRLAATPTIALPPAAEGSLDAVTNLSVRMPPPPPASWPPGSRCTDDPSFFDLWPCSQWVGLPCRGGCTHPVYCGGVWTPERIARLVASCPVSCTDVTPACTPPIPPLPLMPPQPSAPPSPSPPPPPGPSLPSVVFSHRRGWYEQSFELRVASRASDASGGLTTVRCSVDGSDPLHAPDASLACAHNDGSCTLLINSSSQYGGARRRLAPGVTVRCAACRPGIYPSAVQSHTYLFVSDVLTQGDVLPEGDHVFWSTAMDATVVPPGDLTAGGRDYASAIRHAMAALPSVSLSSSWEAVFGASDGIHRGHNLEREDLEAPCAVELIYPATARWGGFQGFGESAGCRIQGGGGRWHFGTYDHKQSFGLRFRSRYGASKLRYPVFESAPLNRASAVETFDKLILRAGHNKGWGATWDPENTVYTRDQLGRDLQIAMGGGYGSHGTFVHLFLNGLYWGLYNLVERPDHSHHASYFGGGEDGYYCGKAKGGDVSGNSSRFHTTLSLMSSASATYPPFEQLRSFVDVSNYVDQALLGVYASVGDYPQFYYGNRMPDGPLRLVAWDLEDSWGGGSVRTGPNSNHRGDTSDEPQLRRLNNIFGFWSLWRHVDFQAAWADRAHMHLEAGGALSSETLLAAWNILCDFVGPAIVAESARWGDERGTQRTYERDWYATRDHPNYGDILDPAQPLRSRVRVLALERSHPRSLVQSRVFGRLPAKLRMDGALATRSERMIQILRDAGSYPEVEMPAVLPARDGTPMAGEAAVRSRHMLSSATLLPPGTDSLRIRWQPPALIYLILLTEVQVSEGAAMDPRDDGGAVSAAAQRVECVESVMVAEEDMDGARWCETNVSLAEAGGFMLRGALADRYGILKWSAPVGGRVDNPYASLVVSEIMYKPRSVTPAEAAAGASTEASLLEFIELHNLDDSASIALGGVAFSGGISYSIPVFTVLPPRSFLVICADLRQFALRYPAVASAVVGGFRVVNGSSSSNGNGLSNGGETIEAWDLHGRRVLRVAYDDDPDLGWPQGADTEGRSLVRNPMAPLGWRDSTCIDGSPGEEDPPPSAETVVCVGAPPAAPTPLSPPPIPPFAHSLIISEGSIR